MDFDLLSPDLRDDPYPHYDRLRAEAPVHRSHLGPWLLARHADGEGVLRGFRRFANIDPVAWHGAEAAPRPLHAVMRRFFLFRIGWTFLARSHWGGRYNGQMKELMLQHAFRFVSCVVFLVGPQNLRSQRAVEKIGGVRVESRPDAEGRDSYVYQITASAFAQR